MQFHLYPHFVLPYPSAYRKYSLRRGRCPGSAFVTKDIATMSRPDSIRQSRRESLSSNYTPPASHVPYNFGGNPFSTPRMSRAPSDNDGPTRASYFPTVASKKNGAQGSIKWLMKISCSSTTKIQKRQARYFKGVSCKCEKALNSTDICLGTKSLGRTRRIRKRSGRESSSGVASALGLQLVWLYVT